MCILNFLWNQYYILSFLVLKWTVYVFMEKYLSPTCFWSTIWDQRPDDISRSLSYRDITEEVKIRSVWLSGHTSKHSSVYTYMQYTIHTLFCCTKPQYNLWMFSFYTILLCLLACPDNKTERILTSSVSSLCRLDLHRDQIMNEKHGLSMAPWRNSGYTVEDAVDEHLCELTQA